MEQIHDGLIAVVNLIAQVPPQPEPVQPPGGEIAAEALGWLAWAAGFAAVGALIVIGIRMMIGMRNRSQMAADSLGSLPWVFGGLVLVSSASAIARAVIG